MDWSLLGCGAKGHITFAPDQPELRERLSATTPEGASWRCLRCGTFVVGEPTSSGPVSAAPRVRRGKELRSAFILRLFAIERWVRALVFGAVAIAIWRFSASRMSIEDAYNHALPQLRTLLRELGFNVHHSKLLGLIQHAFTLNAHTLTWLAVGAGAYAVIEIIEGLGLWLLKRWGEYFAMIATSVGIPYEIYDLTAKVTVLRVGAFIVNLALVLYLVFTKRLFGVRGGKKAYEARLRSASILQAEIDAVAAAQATPAARGGRRDQANRPGEGEAASRPDRRAGPEPPGRPDQPAGVAAPDQSAPAAAPDPPAETVTPDRPAETVTPDRPAETVTPDPPTATAAPGRPTRAAPPGSPGSAR